MNLYSDSLLLENNFRTLSSKNKIDREKASKDIRAHVELAARELSHERFEYFEREILQRVSTFALSENGNDKAGGIQAIRELIDSTSSMTDSKLSQISDTLSESLRNSQDFAILEAITEALGELAGACLVSHIDCIEKQLFIGLEWLGSSNSIPYRKYAACLLLRHLAEKAPTIFFSKVREFFDNIFGALWDSKERIRIAASQAISACLAALIDRTYHLEWYTIIYAKAHEGFKKGTPDSCHGSLLVVGDMLTHTKNFMMPRYMETCTAIMHLRENKSKLVKFALLGLLPQVAAYCPDIFADSYLNDGVDFLVKCNKNADFKAETLLSSGKLCIALGPRISRHIDELLDLVKETLTQGNWKKQDTSHEALRCVANMVIGMYSTTGTVDSSMTPISISHSYRFKGSSSPEAEEPSATVSASFQEKILSLIEPMVQTGLTQDLTDALGVIASKMPSQRTVIKERLVEEAVKILGGSSKQGVVEPDYSFCWSKKGVRVNYWSRLRHGEDQWTFPNVQSLSSSTANARRPSISVPSSSRPVSAVSLHRPTSPPISVTNTATPSSASKSSSSRRGFFSFMSNSRSTTPANSSVSTVSNPVSNTAATPFVVDTDHSNDPVMISLALKTIASLCPRVSKVITLLQGSVLPFFQHDSAEVRLQAVLTCASVLVSSRFLGMTRGPSALATEYLVEKLVEVMVSDSELNVRLSLLRYVSTGFERYLSRQHHIDSLMFLLADECFDVRMETLKIFGRLSKINPATVLPHLRSLLIRFVSELKNAFDNRQKEETALMVCSFLRAMPLQPIVRIFLRPLVVSLPFVNDVRLSAASLEAFGEICLVLRKDATPHVEKLMPIIIANIRDSTSRKKQETAIRTLGQIVSATGIVISPYLQYPQLLPAILDLLFRTSNRVAWSLRQETLRTLGLLGALEPRRYQRIVSFLEQALKKGNNNDIAFTFVHENDNVVGLDGKDTRKAPTLLPTAPHPQPQRLRERSDSTNSVTHMVHRDNHPPMTDKVMEREKFDRLIHSDVLVNEDNVDLPSHLFMYELSAMKSLFEPASKEKSRLLPSNEQFYPQVAIFALIKILKDESLVDHHASAASTIVSIFRTLDKKSVLYIDEILPFFVQLIRGSRSGLQESLLQHITSIIKVCQEDISPYLSLIFDLVVDFWNERRHLILLMVQEIALASPSAFEDYIDRILPLLLGSLSLSELEKDDLGPLEHALKCCNVLRIVLRPHIHLMVPALCKIINKMGSLSIDSHKWLILAIKTLRNISTSAGGSQIEQTNMFVVRIVHTLTHTITTCLDSGIQPASPVYNECIVTLCAIGKQVGSKFLTFDSSVRHAIENKGLDIDIYSSFSSDLRSGIITDYSFNDDNSMDSHNHSSTRGNHEGEAIGVRSHRLDHNGKHHSHSHNSSHRISQHISRSWNVSQRTTSNDWYEWLRRLKLDMVRESPAPIIRACSHLCQAYLPLAHDLFHAAFVSCWQALGSTMQDSLVQALDTAFKSQVVPPEILQTLLNLAEFMEHDVEALPIGLSTLAELAQKNRAYAKALHYRELEFISAPESCFESLININKKLDQYDAAAGVLKLASKIAKTRPALREALKSQEAWLAKLGYWDEALELYENRLAENTNDPVAISGKLKCLEALGRWEEAVDICNSNLNQLRSESLIKGDNIHTKAAVTGARAAWFLQKWDQMDEYLSQLSESNVDGSFMRAVSCIHREEYGEAVSWIENTRKHLDTSVSALLAESYSRSFVPLIAIQQCSELEEVIEYKMLLKESKLLQSDSTSSPVDKNISRSNQPRFLPRFGQRQMSLIELASMEKEDDVPIVTSNNFNASVLNNQLAALKLDLTEKWRMRLRGSCGNTPGAIPFTKYIINGHRLILSERDDLDSWIEFSTLCRKNRNLPLADRVLQMCREAVSVDLRNFSPGETQSMSMAVDYSYLKLKWAYGNHQEALDGLKFLIDSVSLNLGPLAPNDSKVLVQCLLKLGQWKQSMIEPGKSIDMQTRNEITQIYFKAVTAYSDSYRAWHQWGLSNYRAIEEYKFAAETTSPRFSVSSPLMPKRSHSEDIINFAVNAVKGLMRAVSLGTRRVTSSITQDLLCILSVWLKYGKINEVRLAIEQGMSNVHIDNWLGIIPQLIARVDHPERESRSLLHDLIVKLSLRHAQALVFPLSVALKSPNHERRSVAETLMSSLRNHCPTLIDQALLVSQELVRVAIVWEELWHECLEEASRYYYGEGNIQLMFETLGELQKNLESPTTLHEIAFRQLYGKDLQMAWECILESKKILEQYPQYSTPIGVPPVKKPDDEMNPLEKAISRAWKLYFIAFQNIGKKLPSLLSLELSACSPQLLTSVNLDLGVPGTYGVSGSAVKIKSFFPTVAIIKSKQRPRKIRMKGEDGNDYLFLLKGHEDLRQDERAMQLFGLVNALLAHDRRTSIDVEALAIERYAVVPLSPTAGLISWVPHCDTMHDLIREFRDNRRIILNVEHKIMLQQVSGSQGYDILTHIQKMEVFQNALADTAGEDLAKILWLKSTSSESWLHRRSNYTRSLAVMSMVGYILGLGDRHPSNLMLHRDSGKVLHIDFGDCFEVAMQREKFPERVPFRLTRMLVSAMEISGIEGNFRRTCERVMSVLRENSDSLVAILEAFVYDPLISWRLLSNVNQTKKRAEYEGTTTTTSTSETVTSNNGTTVSNTNVSAAVVVDSNSSSTSNAGAVTSMSGKLKSKLQTVVERDDDVDEDPESSDVKTDDQENQENQEKEKEDEEIVKGNLLCGDEDAFDVHRKMQEIANSMSSPSASIARPSIRQMSVAMAKAEADGSNAHDPHQQELSGKAIVVVRRVTDKLSGLDFKDPTLQGNSHRVLDIEEQVDRLIDQATAPENLCQSYIGWCPFW